jgi:hypothetical protein
MDKFERRLQIISKKEESATKQLQKFLEKKNRKLRDIAISIPLEGELNLAILSEMGFTNVDILRFVPGSITGIYNVPSNVHVLQLGDQLIENMGDYIPDSIEHLEMQHNLLSGEMDFTRFTHLKTINVSFNQLSSLGENLPESLEEIVCDHNTIADLFLDNCPKLHKLHCDHNPNLVLHDIPDTVIDRKLPDTVQFVSSFAGNTDTRVNKKNIQQSREVNESILKYFQLKDKYEASAHKSKSKKKTKKPKNKLLKCLGCNRNVGMIFSGKDQKYSAYCGDSASPCSFKIVIHRGDHYLFRDTLQEMIDNLEETKERIIRQKMDTLFQYISEEKSADLFKKQIAFFKTNSEMVDKYMQQYISMYFNPAKTEILQQKRKKIQEKLLELGEHSENGNISEIVRIQMEIKGIAEYIQRESYEFMNVVLMNNDDTRLIQLPVVPSKLEINHGETPKVEHFSR